MGSLAQHMVYLAVKNSECVPEMSAPSAYAETFQNTRTVDLFLLPSNETPRI